MRDSFTEEVTANITRITCVTIGWHIESNATLEMWMFWLIDSSFNMASTIRVNQMSLVKVRLRCEMHCLLVFDMCRSKMSNPRDPICDNFEPSTFFFTLLSVRRRWRSQVGHNRWVCSSLFLKKKKILINETKWVINGLTETIQILRHNSLVFLVRMKRAVEFWFPDSYCRWHIVRLMMKTKLVTSSYESE